MSAAECHEDVTRRGESQPCDRVSVAMRIDADGHHYPVCRTHVRHPMVPLLALVEQAKTKQRYPEAERSYLSVEWERLAQSFRKRAKDVEAERDAAIRKAEDFEGRYETSHASRIHAEDCYRRAVARAEAAEAQVERVRGLCAEADSRLSPFVYKTELNTALDGEAAEAQVDRMKRVRRILDDIHQYAEKTDAEFCRTEGGDGPNAISWNSIREAALEALAVMDGEY